MTDNNNDDDETSSYHSATAATDDDNNSISTTTSSSTTSSNLLHFVAIVEHTVASLPCALYDKDDNSVVEKKKTADVDFNRSSSTKTRTLDNEMEQNSHLDLENNGTTTTPPPSKNGGKKYNRVNTPPLSSLDVEGEEDDDDATSRMVLAAGNNNTPLSNLDSGTICILLEPIRKALESIDAESFMSLERVVGNGDDGSGMMQDGGGEGEGACLLPGIKVHPIHHKITPLRKDLNRSKTSIVRYLHVTELENQYSVGIFVFPPHAVIPLHDHPGMVVLSRVMYGDLIVKSFDIVATPENEDEGEDEDGKEDGNVISPHRQYSSMSFGDASAAADADDAEKEKDEHDADNNNNSNNNRLIRGSSWLSSLLFRPIARTMSSGVSSVSSFYSSSNNNKGGGTATFKKTTTSSAAAALPKGSKKAIQKPIKHLSAPGLSMLFPYEGNAHEFVAGEHGAAVLDVLLPPYCCDHDRNCTFYKAVDENGDDYVVGKGGKGGDVVAASAEKITTTSKVVKDDKDENESNDDDDDDQTMESYQSNNVVEKNEEKEEYCWLKPVPAPKYFHCVSGQYGGLGCVNEGG